MLVPLFFLLFAQQDNSAEIGRLQSEVQRLSTELRQTQALVQSELRPMCSSESHLQTGNSRITDMQTPVRVNLLAIVSNPAETCLPAEVRVTATYVDASGGFVCSGTTNIFHTAPVQNTFLEFRPYEPEVFLKWWDGPTLRQQGLVCRDYQGNEARSPADVAGSVNLFITVAPKRGGLSTSEIQLLLPRFARP